MPITKATNHDLSRVVQNSAARTRVKTCLDAVVDACNGTLPSGFLSADTEGRAAMATGYFAEATATDKFAAGAITTGLLKAGIIAASTAGRALFASGVFDETTVDTAFAAGAIDADRIKSASLTATQMTADLTLAKRTVTVTDDELTGASQAVNIGAVLPANAIVLGHELNVTEQFTGEADTTIIIGGTDTDAIVASTDLDALAIGKYSGTLGAHPQGGFGGQQLVATFAATALEDLSAGSVTITVWYSVLA